MFIQVLEHDEQAVSFAKMNIIGADRTPSFEQFKTNQALQWFVRTLDPVKIRYVRISSFSGVNCCTINCAQIVSACPNMYEYVFGFIVYVTDHEEFQIAKGHVWLKLVQSGEWIDPTSCEDDKHTRLLVESRSYLSPQERERVKIDPFSVKLGAVSSCCIGTLAGCKNLDPVFYTEKFHVSSSGVRLGTFETPLVDASNRKHLKKVARRIVDAWWAGPKPRSSRLPMGKGEPTLQFGKLDGKQRGDVDIFTLNPSRLPGAKPRNVICFPEGGWNFVMKVQTWSDMAYAVKGYCDNELSGARFTTYSVHGSESQYVHWYVESNLFDHRGDLTVLDTIHTDLIDSETGLANYDPTLLSEFVTQDIVHLFLLGFELGPLQGLIHKCHALHSIVLCKFVKDCRLTKQMFRTLATKGEHLYGLHIWECTVCSNVDSNCLRKTVMACPRLKWLCLYIHNLILDEKFFEALPPTLEVLWVQSDFVRGTAGDYQAIRVALGRCKHLRFVMIDPDGQFISSVNGF